MSAYVHERRADRCVAFVALALIAALLPQVSFADNTAPNVPSVPRPFDGAAEQMIGSSVSWVGGDPDGDNVTYDIYFGASDDPPLVATGVATPYYIPPTLEFITSYHWRVVARDPAGLEAASPTWSFVTKENTPPIPPFDPTPANLGYAPPTVTLRWRSGDTDLQPVTYRVLFGTTNPPPQVAAAISDRFFDVGPLQANTVYYWRVVASDGTFNSSSLVWRFYVMPLAVEASTWGRIKALYR